MSASERSKGLTGGGWVAQVAVAGILGMTLPFKLTGAEESVILFEEIAGSIGMEGMSDAMRIGLALAELLVVVLLLVPRTAALGGLAALGMMTGAALTHIALVGIEVPVDRATPPTMDGGGLFTMALIALAASAFVVVIRRKELPIVGGE